MAVSQEKATKSKRGEQQWIEYKSKYLQVTMQQKLNCSFDRWYTTFKKITIKSKIIPINETFIEYLKADGLKLPPQIQNEMDGIYELDSDNDSEDAFAEDDGDGDGNNVNSDDDSKSEEEEDDAEEEIEIDFSKMDDLLTTIAETIKKLKGAVVPKLNWSSPSDAKWINTETLKCEYVSQILLLLKSSQFIQHDLCYPFYGCSDFKVDESNGDDDGDDDDDDGDNQNKNENAFNATQPPEVSYNLVLRKYCNLHPNREFRCFVYDQKLIAIAQRNEDIHAELQSKSARDGLTESINGWYIENVQSKFVNDHFVMDVYVDNHGRIYLIDFQPFNEFTDSIISWMEICKVIVEDTEEILFGFVDSNHTNMMKGSSKSQYRFPIDAVDLENQKQINEFVESCEFQK